MATDSIRPARPEDVPAIIEAIRALARYEKLEHEMVGTVEQLHQHLFGERPVCECLVGEQGGALAGLALYFTAYSTFWTQPFLHLEDLFVYPEQRGTGLGAKLLQGVAAVAVERGYPRLQWHVLDWNTPAIDFYKKLGAEILEDWEICRMSGDALTALGS